MLINADMTVYEKDTYIRHGIRAVYWNDLRGRSVTKNGIQISDSISVYLYSDEYIPQTGDIIMKGISEFEFDTSSQRGISESMKLFRFEHPDFGVVKSVADYMFGGLPHIEITAR